MNRWPPNFVRQRPGSPLHCPHHHPLIRLSVQLRQLDGPTAIIHTEPSPRIQDTQGWSTTETPQDHPWDRRRQKQKQEPYCREGSTGSRKRTTPTWSTRRPVNHVTLAVVTANLNACLWTLHGVYSSLVGNDCSIFPLDLCRSSVRSFVFHIGDFSKCIFFLQSYRAILFMLAQFRGGYLEFKWFNFQCFLTLIAIVALALLPPGISFLSSLKHVACLRMPLDVLGKTKYLSTMADHIPRRFLQPCCNRQKNQISVVGARYHQLTSKATKTSLLLGMSLFSSLEHVASQKKLLGILDKTKTKREVLVSPNK